MLIFFAVMLTDVLLLDTFNSLGLPYFDHGIYRFRAPWCFRRFCGIQAVGFDRNHYRTWRLH